MTDIINKVREHYSATGLTDRIKAALMTIAPESQALTVAQLAPLDQFHTRGILATADWLAPRGSIHPPARWISAAASAGQRAISPRPSAAR